MDISRKICPYCGKHLSLQPPAQAYLPNLMGRSKNSIEFCFRPEIRLFSYTKQPYSGYERASATRSLFENNNITRDFGNIEGSRRLSRGTITLPYIRRCLAAESTSALFKPYLLFLCGNCKHCVAINKNPLRLSGFIGIFWIAVMFVSMLGMGLYLANAINSFLWIILLIGGSFIATIIYYIFSYARIYSVMAHENNFAPINDNGDLESIPAVLKLHSAVIPRRYLHESNILSAELFGKTYQLYITKFEQKQLDMYICGVNGEQQELISLLRASEELPKITLCFEGRTIGTAEITELYELPAKLTESDEQDSPAALSEWHCDNCGYFNSPADTQCRSCGEYK